MLIKQEKKRIPVLMYHSIALSKNPKYKQVAVPPSSFAEQMAYLHEYGYTPLAVTQFIIGYPVNFNSRSSRRGIAGIYELGPTSAKQRDERKGYAALPRLRPIRLERYLLQNDDKGSILAEFEI